MMISPINDDTGDLVDLAYYCGPACASDDPGAMWDSGPEMDYPIHCESCEDLINVPLSSYGYRYVYQAVIDHLTDGDGRAEIVEQWRDEYTQEDLLVRFAAGAPIADDEF